MKKASNTSSSSTATAAASNGDGGGAEAKTVPAPSSSSSSNSSDVVPSTNLLVLNEVVIDRGPSPYLSNIDLYLDGKLITSVQGDGLIISTPTGTRKKNSHFRTCFSEKKSHFCMRTFETVAVLEREKG